MGKDSSDDAARGKLGDTDQVDAITLQDRVVISRICKGSRQYPLFLQIGFVDPGKRAGNNRPAAHMPGTHGGMFPG